MTLYKGIQLTDVGDIDRDICDLYYYDNPNGVRGIITVEELEKKKRNLIQSEIKKGHFYEVIEV